MAKVADFSKDIMWGGIGETIIMNFLRIEKPGSTLKDISKGRMADIRITTPDKKSYELEVKFDSYDTGNIFLETQSNDKKKTLGCIEKSNADFLFYILPFIRKKEQSMLIFTVAGLKVFMKTSYFAKLREIAIKNVGYNTL